MLSCSLQGKAMSMAYLNPNSRILGCVATRFFQNTKDQRKLLACEARERSLQCSVVA